MKNEELIHGNKYLLNKDIKSKDSVKLGRIRYMNVLPVYYKFSDLVKNLNIKTIDAAPSILNAMLSKGILDISPVSSAAYAHHSEDWLILPELSISCFGKVMSVKLVSKFSLDKLNNRKVTLTNESASAVALLKLLLKFEKITPKFNIASIKSPDDVIEQSDAALIIGDAALKEKWENYFEYVYDLGSLWKEKTQHPFVFAIWSVRKNFVKTNPKIVELIIDLLQNSKNEGLKNLEIISKISSQKLGIDKKICQEYYSVLNYDLNNLQISGLKLFYNLLQQNKIITKKIHLSFV